MPPLRPLARRAAAALASLALPVAFAAAGAARAAEAGGAAAELAAAHEELWSELRAAAGAAAGSLGGPPAGDAGRARAFRDLGAASAATGGRTLLLLDPLGELVAWGGPGLLHAPPLERARERPCGATESAASVTLWCAERLAARGAGQWIALAGESFAKAGEPPVASAARGRFRARAWRLVDAGGELPRIEVEAAGRARPALERRALGGALLAAASLGLAALAAYAARLGVEARWRRWAGPAAASAVGPLLFAAFASPLGARVDSPGPALFGSAAESVGRLAAVLLALAALALAPDASEPRRARRALWLAAGGAALAASVWVERAPFALALVAAAGLALARAGARPGFWPAAGTRPRRPGAEAAAWIAAALLAGAAATAAEAERERRAATRLATRLLPPAPAALKARIEPLEAALAERAAAVLAATPRLSLPPADLAYAIWRDSPLARADARSALAVGLAEFPPSRFAYGLPVDALGRLDPAPARWTELDPAPWRARAIAGELDVDGADGARWRLRWTLVPRPGFADPAPPLDDLASGLLRGGAGRGPALALPPGARAVVYGADGAPLLAPWSEGTPPLDGGWLAAGAGPPRVATPEGAARALAAAGEGVTAVVFLSAGRWTAALESLGAFAAGPLLLAAALAGGALLVVLRPEGAGRALRRWLRSYSQRLLLVFSAFVLAPTVLLYALLASALERRLEREQERRARDALHSAQRVLGEYVLSLDPGFVVGTALDDRLLEWLARVVRHEIHLYWGSEVYATSKRELFSSGLSPGRIPGEIWERVALAGEPLARRTARAGRHDYVELYAPLEVPGHEGRTPQFVLALPLLAQQEDLAAEIGRVRRRVLLGALALCALLAATGVALAKSFARPIRDLVDGTRRIAEGAVRLGFRPSEAELESLAEAIDAMASRIAEGRARLLAEKGLVERIVENVTAAVVALDRDGRVLLANRCARERLAAQPGEELRAGLARTGLDRLAAAFDSARPGVEAVATEAPSPTGGRAWTLARVPLDGGEPAELVVIEDVTDVSRAQRLEAWAAMARIIAHEIKNPLTPIRLSAEHLREAWARDRAHFEGVFERCTENILAQVEELRRTASEFSLYAEIPQSEKRRCDLGEVVAEVVEGYRAAPPPGIAVSFRGPERALVGDLDRRLVGRAVRNLIENALRAQAGGGEIEIEVGARDGRGYVRVADRGPGVEPELLDKILEPYFSTHSGGTGLGLPIARRVALEHGGELAVRNRPGGGFEVTITIPVG